MKNSLPFVLGQVETERSLQDEEWGGSVHDDTHQIADWLEQITRQLNFATNEISDYAQFRQRLIKISALAVAGIESQDRLRFNQSKNTNSPFEEWIKQVKEVGISYNLYSSDSDVPGDIWRDNYDNGKTPLEAVIEDISLM